MTEHNLNEPLKVLTRDQLKDHIKQNQTVEIKSISPWTAITDLPSKFKPYPEAKIWYKSFSYGELEQWTNPSLTEEEKIDLGLQGIKTENLDKLDIDLQDFYYLMLMRKLSTFKSPRFKLKFECPHCNQTSISNPELLEIQFEELELIEELPVVLQMADGRELSFKPVSLADYIRFKQSGKEDNRINRLALQIQNLTFEQAVEYIENVTDIDDMEILDELDTLLNFGNQTIEVECKECEGKVIVPIQGVSALAEPFREPKRTLKDSIIPSKK